MGDELESAPMQSDIDVPKATNEPSADLKPNPTLNDVLPGPLCSTRARSKLVYGLSDVNSRNCNYIIIFR